MTLITASLVSSIGSNIVSLSVLHLSLQTASLLAPSFTPTTYLCKHLGIHAVAASIQPEELCVLCLSPEAVIFVSLIKIKTLFATSY
ncbi:hypothetical protein C3432_18330 [Citrobacter amalonaticus]|uniref:Uncharacterized protein n=1 Tax=Citrobacter amalonaticus TaxID=35703 RepID=A0A2S4RWZ8_CITAM|nr:hypothetical protein C3432_18330 [Citrobacter amalonaticus]POT74256.1 hypothetical protein C3436_15970 [Citrobacter amalonaticus]POU65057.1 hypothetical protein C3430_12710 [Citrobacter amalonaticus]POV03891.1 hypothetical protein C3424_17650 [Citrobacter amalonaticus]